MIPSTMRDASGYIGPLLERTSASDVTLGNRRGADAAGFAAAATEAAAAVAIGVVVKMDVGADAVALATAVADDVIVGRGEDPLGERIAEGGCAGAGAGRTIAGTMEDEATREEKGIGIGLM